jgi:hypothetical protein
MPSLLGTLVPTGKKVPSKLGTTRTVIPAYAGIQHLLLPVIPANIVARF